jgi:DNA-binding CsgD family transcriptional regulator
VIRVEEDGMARLPLRGRSEEISRALATLRRVSRAGQSAIVAITGEPGIGKTAVVRTILEQAGRMGFATGYGKAEAIDQIAPGAPLLVALRSGANPLLDGDAFHSLAPLQGQPLWFVDQVAATIDKLAKQSPVLIAIDDVQWADRLSLFALRLLPARLAGSPVVWLLASREPSDDLRSEWAASSIDGVSLQHILIKELSDEALDTIARDLLGLRPSGKSLERLHSLGGNPLLAIQLLEGLARAPDPAGDDALPVSLVATIRSRVSTLSADDADFLRIAAVWGRPIDTHDLALLVGGQEKAQRIDAVLGSVERGTRLGILTVNGECVAFRHDLVREAIYIDIPGPARRALHRRCARFLLAHGGPLAAAPHALAAATPGDDEAVGILRRAAGDIGATAPEAAASLMRSAFELVPHSDPQWLPVGEQCADILAQAQRGREAIDVVDTMLGQPLDPDTEARLQVIAANALWLMGLLEDSARRLDAAMARHGVSEAQAVRLAAARARVLTRTASSRDAASAAGRVLDEARRMGDEPAELVALQSLGEIAKNEGRHDAALNHFHSLRQAAGVSYLAQEVAELQLLDRFVEADKLLAAAERNRRANPDAVMPSLVNVRLWQNFYLGRFEEATVNANNVIQLSNDLGTYVHKFDAWQLLSLIAALAGDYDRARTLLGHVERGDEADADVRVAGVILAKSYIASAAGDCVEAIRLVKPMLDTADVTRNYWPRSHEWARYHAGMARVAGDEQFAEQSVARAEIASERNPGVASYRGLALQTRGYVERDATLLGDAVEILRLSPRPALVGMALADHGEQLLSTPHRELAIDRLQEAAAIFERIGYRTHRAAVIENLSRAGIPELLAGKPIRRSENGWVALTDTERAVAELVVRGQTNKAVAFALGISVNTVGTHLRSVFTKIGVHSRVHLANAWNAECANDT